METKLCGYIVTIADEGCVSRAAEKLYLTQSALNQQLLKLERELGTPLFIRQRNHWTLTPAGMVYVENARKILSIKASAYAQIEDLAERWKGTVSIGLPTERGMRMFSAIYSDVHARFPSTTFEPVQATVDEQNHLLQTGQLDIAFQTIRERKCNFLTYEVIMKEPFVLCIPRSHPLAYQEELPADCFPMIDLSLFKDDVFTIVRRSSNMRPMVDDLFKKAGFYPQLLFDSAGMHAMQKLTANGLCCCIIPRIYAVPSKQVAYFLLAGDASWDVTAVYRNDHYVNKATRAFIDAASDYWKTHLYLE